MADEVGGCMEDDVQVGVDVEVGELERAREGEDQRDVVVRDGGGIFVERLGG